jgi:ElaB/YqjD/DUF883 family membrane-anchored ribosome-binding protein
MSTSAMNTDDLPDTTPVAEAPPPTMERVVRGAHQTIDALHERTRQWRGLQDEWTECARVTVRENPLATVATALALGALLGMLCSRR